MGKQGRKARNERHIRVVGVRRDKPDLKRLGRALVELAQAQAEVEAEADRHQADARARRAAAARSKREATS